MIARHFGKRRVPVGFAPFSSRQRAGEFYGGAGRPVVW